MIRTLLYSLLAAWLLSGCGNLNTHVTVMPKKVPSAFDGRRNGTATVAHIKWRQYFSDPDLQRLIDIALASNLDMQMALQRIELARSSIKLANAALLPEVRLNIGGGVEKFGRYTMDGAGNASTEITPGRIVPENLTDIYVGIQTAWEVDLWGKLRNLRKSAIAGYLGSIEGTRLVTANLVTDVALYYNELQTLDHQLDIIRQTLVKQKEALEIVKWQKEGGRANRLAVEQFEARLLDTRALERSVQQKIVTAENRLNFLLGRFPQPIARDKAAFLAELPSVISAGLPSQMLANRPDIREAEYRIQATQFDLKAAKAAFYPNFNITAALGFQAFNPEFLFTTPASLAYSAFGSLVAPLINLNSLKAKFNTAKANQLTALYNYQKTILQAYVEVANELNNIRYLQKITGLKHQQTAILEDAMETSNELYNYAKATYLEVLTAQQKTLETQLELIDAIKRQRIALINIYKALGGGWK